MSWNWFHKQLSLIITAVALLLVIAALGAVYTFRLNVRASQMGHRETEQMKAILRIEGLGIEAVTLSQVSRSTKLGGSQKDAPGGDTEALDRVSQARVLLSKLSNEQGANGEKYLKLDEELQRLSDDLQRWRVLCGKEKLKARRLEQGCQGFKDDLRGVFLRVNDLYYEELISKKAGTVKALRDLQANCLGLMKLVGGLSRPTEALCKDAEERVDQLNKIFNGLATEGANMQTVKTLDALGRSIRGLKNSLAAARDADRALRRDSKQLKTLLTQLQDRQKELKAVVGDCELKMLKQVEAQQSEARGLFFEGLILISTLSILGVAFVLIYGIKVGRGIVNPLKNVTEKLRGLSTNEAPVTGTIVEKALDLSQENEIGDLSRAVLVIQSRLGQAFREAQKHSELKSDFLANMSHEIRTPLNGLLGMTDLLLATELDETQREFAQIAQKSGQSLLGLINDILDFSKIEAGMLELEHIDFNLRDLVEEAAILQMGVAAEKNLELSVFFDTKVPVHVLGDPTRLSQVIRNLLSNGIKFTKTGEVSVRVGVTRLGTTDAQLKFEVKDTGIGIEQKRIEKLFHSFTQADVSTTRDYGGTGLGLAICKTLVELMGGGIQVSSEIGVGTTMSFDIVLGLGAQISESPIIDLSAAKILFIDDAESQREIVQEYLGDHVAQLDLVGTCEEGLENIEEAFFTEPYQVALIDQVFPGMRGVDLARYIRSNPRLEEFPLVLVSGSMEFEKEESDLFQFVLHKPIRYQKLFEVLRDAFKKKALKLKGKKSSRFPRESLGDHAGAKVLIVDDNAVNQKVAAGCVRNMGLSYTIAKNGEEAIEAAKKDFYEIILMDCQMPVVDGYQATETIRGLEKEGQRSVIIAVSANAYAENKRRCMIVGMDDFLSKPHSSDQLISIIKLHLTSKREML